MPGEEAAENSGFRLKLANEFRPWLKPALIMQVLYGG
jgi:hypothetical protein